MNKIGAKDSLKELRRYPIISLIMMERLQQNVKWGEQNHDNYKWLAILMEEIGEAAKAITEDINNQNYPHLACIENLEIELVQSAAVIIQWIECLRRNEFFDLNKKEENEVVSKTES